MPTNKVNNNIKLKSGGGLANSSADGLSVDGGVTAGKVIVVAAGDKLPAVDGSQLTNIGTTLVFNPGVTTDAAVTTTTQTKTISQDVTIVPKYFEAYIIFDLQDTIAWTAGFANGTETRAVLLVKGNITTSSYEVWSLQTSNLVPNGTSYGYPNGFFPGGNPTLGSFGRGTMTNATANVEIGTSGGTEKFKLASITLTGTTLNFNFTFTQGNRDGGLRYGVSNLIVSN